VGADRPLHRLWSLAASLLINGAIVALLVRLAVAPVEVRTEIAVELAPAKMRMERVAPKTRPTIPDFVAPMPETPPPAAGPQPAKAATVEEILRNDTLPPVPELTLPEAPLPAQPPPSDPSPEPAATQVALAPMPDPPATGGGGEPGGTVPATGGAVNGVPGGSGTGTGNGTGTGEGTGHATAPAPVEPPKAPERIPEKPPEKTPEKPPEKVPEKVPEKAPDPPPAPVAHGERRPARLVRQTKPAYPPDARRDGVEGTAVLRVKLDPAGAVTDVEVVTTTGDARLDAAAIAAVKGWTFAPKLDDGAPVAASLRVRVEFSLH
jgi:protein TonB